MSGLFPLSFDNQLKEDGFLVQMTDRVVEAELKEEDDSPVVQKVKREINEPTSKELNSVIDEIKGNGRCLRLSYNAKKDRYEYKGHECSARQNYLCEFEDNPVQNEINRVAKSIAERRP